MDREKIVLCWSGGKDSARSLYELKKDDRYQVVALLTTMTEEYDRISMHGVRRELLQAQADALGLPVNMVFITPAATNAEYETRMSETLERYKLRGITKIAFGDIFLEDLRRYREDNLAKLGMAALFPIWKRDSGELSTSFIALGFKAVLTCVDLEKLDASFAGRSFDANLLRDLPGGVDPCGENGEFHSFVFDGPIFQKEVQWIPGERVARDGRFCFFDLQPQKEFQVHV